MKCKLLMLAVCSILLLSLTMSGVIYDDPKTSYIIDGGDIISEDMVTFLVRHPAGYTISTLEGVEPGAQQQYILFGASGFNINEPVPAGGATTHATLHHSIYTSNGRFLYTMTMGGTVYLVEKLGEPLTPRWHNGEGVVISEEGIVQAPDTPDAFQSPAVNHLTITTGVSSGLPLIESAGNIYFWKGNELHYLPINSGFSNYDRTLETYGVYDYDIYNGRVYIMGAYNSGTTRVLDFFEWTSSGPEVLHSEVTGSGSYGVTTAGHMQVINNDVFYLFGHDFRKQWASPAEIKGIYNRTAYVEPLPASPPVVWSGHTRSMMSLSTADNYMAVGKNNDGIEIVSTDHKKEVHTSPFESSDLTIDYIMTSRQNSYFNNTPLDVRVYMELTGTLNALNGAKNIVEDTTFEVLLYGPEGMMIGRFQVPDTAWKYKTEFTGLNFNQIGTVSRTIEFQPTTSDWEAGTHTFRLTEYSIERGQYQIGEHSVLVANESGTVGGGTVAPDDVSADDIFSSTAFKALMFILLPALGLGLVAGISGALVGLVLGIILAFAAGLIGLPWVILTIFATTVSFAAFARDTIIGGGRGGV